MGHKRFLAFLTALVLVVSLVPVHSHAAGTDPLDAMMHQRQHAEGTTEILVNAQNNLYRAPLALQVLPSGTDSYLADGTFDEICQWGIGNDECLYIWCDGKMPVRETPEEYPWHAYQSLFRYVYIDSESVSMYAFANCDNLELVEFSGQLAQIDQYAFTGCNLVDQVWFYGSAPSICDNAFAGVEADIICHYGDSTWDALWDHSFGGTLFWYRWVDVLEQGIYGDVEWYIFEDMSMELWGNGGAMASQESWEDYPWHPYAADIHNITCYEISSVGNYAFVDFSALERISFDDSLVHIGDSAFCFCENFTLSFGGDAPSLGEEVFSSKDFTLDFPSDNPTWTEEAVRDFYEDDLGINELPAPPQKPNAIPCALTAQQVYDAMIALKPQYPEGMPWTNDNFYAWNGGHFSGGYGCAGFAFILSDAAFGMEPCRLIYDNITIDDIRVGDILRINGDTHSVIVLEVHDDHVVIAEGNYNSSIHWGRTLTADTIAATTDYIMTRYPEHQWNVESCVIPRTCTACGLQEEAPGHKWVDATCVSPRYCKVCNLTQGAATGIHTYSGDADVSCNVCGYIRDAVDVPTTPFSAFELEVLRLTNLERLAAGLDPLTTTLPLQNATDVRAEEVLSYFSHTRPDGSQCFTVLDEFDIVYYAAAENIASGHPTPAAVVQAWMNSPGHRSNIMDPYLGHMGVGEKDRAWVQLFTDAALYYAIRVDVPQNTVFPVGTSIEEMGLVAVLQAGYGDCWLPLDSSYCTGFDPNLSGTQTVTVTVLDVVCTFTVEIGDGSHTHSWVEATCTTPKTCTSCGATEGEPLAHNWQDATCTTPKTCAACGATEGEPLAHDWKDATCTTPKTCSACGATDGEPLAHNWQDATCTTPKTCSACGATEGEPLAHSWQDATCTTPKTCAACGATEGEPLAHNWQDATCTTPKTCAACGATEGAALNHDWDSGSCETPGTCRRCGISSGTAPGHQWQDATCAAPKTCSACGATEGEPLAHDWKDATCTAPKTCAACGTTEGDPLTHDWKDATCTTPKTCARCGSTEGEPLTHDWKDATCTTPKTCSACGATEGEPLTHDWKDATCTTPKTCARCGSTEGSALPHTFQDGTCIHCGADKRKLGDADGDNDISYLDAIAVLRYSVGLIPTDPALEAICNVNRDTSVDYLDAVMILRYSVGLITEFPSAK